MTDHVSAAINAENFSHATKILEQSVANGQVRAASLYICQGDTELDRQFGLAKPTSPFLLASITKPIVTALAMTLCEQGLLHLSDTVQQHLPQFHDGGREGVALSHLMTHVSGLPDQLPQNSELRQRHATLDEFVTAALHEPLQFTPGTRFQYSSMGILLLAEIIQRRTQQPLASLVATNIFRPLGMTRCALGLGPFPIDETMTCQVEFGARESGGGSSESRSWDWNSDYWRTLGSPWGGAHGTSADVGRFLSEFLRPQGRLFRDPRTAQQMITNHNAPGIQPRGLGFDIGPRVGGAGCSAQTFGHSGSTGTLAWADPDRNLICVVLTTLPTHAVARGDHPCDSVSNALLA